MGRGYPNPLQTRMIFDFSSPLSMDRATGKYMRVRYETGKVKFFPTPPISNALMSDS